MIRATQNSAADCGRQRPNSTYDGTATDVQFDLPSSGSTITEPYRTPEDSNTRVSPQSPCDHWLRTAS